MLVTLSPRQTPDRYDLKEEKCIWLLVSERSACCLLALCTWAGHHNGGWDCVARTSVYIMVDRKQKAREEGPSWGQDTYKDLLQCLVPLAEVSRTFHNRATTWD